MKIIANTKLFNTLKEIAKTDPSDGELVEALYNFADPELERCGGLKDDRVPSFQGGLDHVEVTDRGVYFYDRGFTLGGKYLDNSFLICPEKEKEV